MRHDAAWQKRLLKPEPAKPWFLTDGYPTRLQISTSHGWGCQTEFLFGGEIIHFSYVGVAIDNQGRKISRTTYDVG